MYILQWHRCKQPHIFFAHICHDNKSLLAVSCVEWSPHAATQSLAATAANTHTYLWDLNADDQQGAMLAKIYTHRRYSVVCVCLLLFVYCYCLPIFIVFVTVV
jgi:hypothetical protein